MTVTLADYAVLSALVLGIGLIGVAIRRSAVAQLAALLLVCLAPPIAAAGFAQLGPDSSAPFGGALAAVCVVALLGEFAVAVAATLVLRRREAIDLDITGVGTEGH